MKLPASSVRWAVRALAVAAVLGFVWLVARFWHPVYGFTAFLQVDADNEYPKIAAFHDQPVYLYHHAGGYDGQFYAQLAYDPTLANPEFQTTIDDVAYRGRRILMPALAWLLSGGRPAWIAQVDAALNVAAWLVLAALLWRLLAVTDARGFIAWAGLLFSVGALGSVRLALTDLPALVLVAAAVWSFERARPHGAAGWLAAAALTRETSLLAWPGLWSGSWRSPAAVGRNLLRGALVAAPLVAWLGYLRWRVGGLSGGADNLAWPLNGLVDKWHEGLAAVLHPDNPLLAWTTLLATAGLTAQALFVLLRPRPADPWWRAGVGFVALLAVLGTPVWEGTPGAATRVLLPLQLASNVLAQRTRAPLGWLLACNLTVFAGLVTLRDVPYDRYELAAVRQHGLACVLRLDPSWYGREVNAHHTWSWSAAGGGLEFDCWPRSARVAVQATLRLQSPSPARATIVCRGRTLWSGPVGQPLTTVTLPPEAADAGRLELTITTDGAPVRERGGADARQLGLALFDPVIRLGVAPASP